MSYEINNIFFSPQSLRISDFEFLPLFWERQKMGNTLLPIFSSKGYTHSFAYSPLPISIFLAEIVNTSVSGLSPVESNFSLCFTK